MKVLSRNPDDYVRETKNDIHRVQRNYDPALHPFEAAREYTQALNATKLERVFAKPFVGSLDGHKDGVHCMTKHPKSLSTLLSGSCDGEIRVWDLASRQCRRSVVAHTGFVRGVCVNPDGHHFYSVGDDYTIKQWSMESPGHGVEDEPVNTILGKTISISIDHHWKDNMFATCGQQVEIWDENRTDPIRSFTWGTDSIHSVKFNPIETHILGSCAADRNIVLYDMRGSAPLRKVILDMKSNAITWNPIEAFVFTAANEDYNLYTFDMRRLDMPVNILMGHVSAVLDVDYAPTGRELVSGSFDKSVRIFPADKSRSREVYHTKRMQHVNCVKWSMDNKYIVSGSAETNIRVWKARAAEKLGMMRPRERAALDYGEKLKEKYQHFPQMRRISRHRHVPRAIYTEAKTQRIQRDSRKRKERNIRRHSKAGTVPFVPERKKHVVAEVQ